MADFHTIGCGDRMDCNRRRIYGPFSLVGPYIPLPFGAWVACMDWKYLIVWVIIILVNVALYYPFFKIVEKRALDTEQSKVRDTRTLEDIEFDF